MRISDVLRTGLLTVLCVSFGSASWGQSARKTVAPRSTPPAAAGLNDDFRDGEHTYKQWSIAGGEGAAIQEETGLRLGNTAQQPPILFTRRNPFPATGDWSFSFVYRFKKVGEYGPTVACVDGTGKAVVALFQEGGSQRQVLALQGVPVWSASITPEWRVVSVTRTGQKLTAYVNGQKVGARDAGGAQPRRVLMGSAVAEDSLVCSAVDIQLVRVSRKVVVLDRLAIRGQDEEDDSSIRGMAARRPRTAPRPADSGENFPADRVAAARFARNLYQSPSGAIGRVNGLSVAGNKGSRLRIEATVLPGKGRVRLRNRSYAMALESAETAADYVRRHTTQVDWLTSDVVFSYDTRAMLYGNSAGIANVTALLSSVNRLSIDQSIAMTGGIQVNGQVDPVGLVGAKALTVLTSADLSTLILPAACVTDLQGLWKSQPRLFLEKRIVLVNNIDQVLDYALIGRSERVTQARAAMLQGLNHYADGDFKNALDDFRKAQQHTPEDASIGLWIYQTRNAIDKANIPVITGRN